ncbi:MAG: hypothetical protein IJ794_11515 [Lachnospiraceae bacterium]|nr:hypothetical protein [Lachnospiraceae bacterium]
MGLFKSKEEKELDALIGRVEVNMSNNYKDAAQEDFKTLEETWEEMLAAGKLKWKARGQYEAVIEGYRERLVGYTHKDQKPYWT